MRDRIDDGTEENDEPGYEPEDCSECGEEVGMEDWDEDEEAFLCPNCGEPQ